MKRSPGDDKRRHASPDNRLEEFLEGFLTRHSRYLMYAGIGIAIVELVVLVLGRASGKAL